MMRTWRHSVMRSPSSSRPKGAVRLPELAQGSVSPQGIVTPDPGRFRDPGRRHPADRVATDIGECGGGLDDPSCAADRGGGLNDPSRSDEETRVDVEADHPGQGRKVTDPDRVGGDVNGHIVPAGVRADNVEVARGVAGLLVAELSEPAGADVEAQTRWERDRGA